MSHPQPNNHLTQRLNLFKQNLFAHSIDAALISKKESIFYLTGLIPQHPTEREAFLIITPKEAVLFHSPFIDLDSPPPDHLRYLAMTPVTPLNKLIPKVFGSKVTTIGIEKNNLTVSELERGLATVPDKQLEAVDLILAEQKLIKDTDEQKNMFKSGKIAQMAMAWCQKLLNQPESVGMTEIEVAQKLDAKLIELGADGPAFPTIVAFDDHSAKPHHRPDTTKLKHNSIVLIDMGASYQQYLSDMTRTWSNQTHSRTFKLIEATVLSAYNQALSAARPGVTARHLDQTARKIINEAGFGDNFIHSTGHGIGTEAHEIPHLSAIDLTPLIPGVCFTIEPGIYLNHKFGYRHENTFIMTATGAKSTT